MQNQIINPGDVLGADGALLQKGYSTRAVLRFNRKAIKARPWRIKEWDFYQVSNDDYCLQLTIGHASYVGEISFKLFEFKTGVMHQFSHLLFLPFNRLKLPESADQGDIAFKAKNLFMQFQVYNGGRRLMCRTGGGKFPTVDIDVRLSQPDPTSLVIATPFDESEKCFYYNHKINCMPAKGVVKIEDKVYRFEPESAFGLLDWGRGVWPFHNEWYWGSGSGWVEGKRFGFNIGYGFGNTSAATENMLFYDGVAHKISHVHFDLAGSGGYMAKKRFTSDDGRFEMEFTPIYDRYTEAKALFLDNRCHQLFGTFNGKAVLDDGQVIEVKDLVAFAEHAVNNW
ncbi:DUF2804 domain-containing protein [Cohnella cholangitidis]|uniref:DUF2804 domain-containing protein n=1 Tax=Cohnella cholangitidis TaxID=2598458 RepID=A0A7G5C0H1_9BACL|nr:DUF2804 domain-containing protein [Cohnella cholangitidis]QMV42705.1 DUF2804 domain-containing protein [Cohnella cholangitidis]